MKNNDNINIDFNDIDNIIDTHTEVIKLLNLYIINNYPSGIFPLIRITCINNNRYNIDYNIKNINKILLNDIDITKFVNSINLMSTDINANFLYNIRNLNVVYIDISLNDIDSHYSDIKETYNRILQVYEDMVDYSHYVKIYYNY
jgi:hypothetical protein